MGEALYSVINGASFAKIINLDLYLLPTESVVAASPLPLFRMKMHTATCVHKYINDLQYYI